MNASFNPRLFKRKHYKTKFRRKQEMISNLVFSEIWFCNVFSSLSSADDWAYFCVAYIWICALLLDFLDIFLQRLFLSWSDFNSPIVNHGLCCSLIAALFVAVLWERILLHNSRSLFWEQLYATLRSLAWFTLLSSSNRGFMFFGVKIVWIDVFLYSFSYLRVSDRIGLLLATRTVEREALRRSWPTTQSEITRYALNLKKNDFFTLLL